MNHLLYIIVLIVYQKPGDLTGTYSYNFQFNQHKLELNQDGYYYETLSGCLSDDVFTGTWEINQDTLLLCRDYWIVSRSKYVAPPVKYKTDRYLIRGENLQYLSDDIAGVFAIKHTLTKEQSKEIINEKKQRKKRK